MTTGHIFFIPLMIAVGFVLGLLLGRRSHEMEAAEQERLAARKEARRQRVARRDAADDGGAQVDTATESGP